MKRIVRKSTMIILVLSLALVPASALGSKALPDGTERTLMGHTFMPSQYVDDPFVATTVGNSVGGGKATSVARPFYDLDGNLLFTYEGEIFFVALGLDYQQNLWETWSVRLAVEGLVRTGSNMESLLSEGATMDREIDLNVQKRIWRGDKTQVTASLDWIYSNITLFSLRDFAEYIWNGGNVEDAPLTDNVTARQTKLGVAAAHALTPGLGLRGSLKGGSYDVSDGSKAVYDATVMVDWDLKPRLKIPLGVSLGYLWGAPTDDPHTGMSGGVLGFWYTGTKDFTVGLETGYWSKPTYQSTEDTDGVVALLSMRYWF